MFVVRGAPRLSFIRTRRRFGFYFAYGHFPFLFSASLFFILGHFRYFLLLFHDCIGVSRDYLSVLVSGRRQCLYSIRTIFGPVKYLNISRLVNVCIRKSVAAFFVYLFYMPFRRLIRVFDERQYVRSFTF